MDPLTKSYPWYTPYQFAGNIPIRFIDLDGLEPENNPDSPGIADSAGIMVVGAIATASNQTNQVNSLRYAPIGQVPKISGSLEVNSEIPNYITDEIRVWSI